MVSTDSFASSGSCKYCYIRESKSVTIRSNTRQGNNMVL